MYVTVSEFASLYPEFASCASESAEAIDKSSRGKNVVGEDTFPEDLLHTACHVREMERRSVKKHGRIFSNPEQRAGQYQEANTEAAEAGVTFTIESSPRYWEARMAIAERRSRLIAAILAP